MDRIDKQILEILQRNADTPLQQIAEVVGLSSTPCWRRMQSLQQSGLITQKVALLDQEKINLGVTVFVSIKTASHSKAWYKSFCALVRDIPEVLDFYRMSGEVDYLLRVVVPDIKTFDLIYKKLVSIAELRDVSSSFAMEKIKSTTALPLDYL